MEKGQVLLGEQKIEIYSLNTVIVGSGAAGLNAADRLYSLGQKDIALVTEGMKMGTSRNTGSDKQTYYKLTQAGSHDDSVRAMTEDLFQGGCMDGDLALVEAALSTRCFYHLVDIGVPFPHNRYGEYVGYKTDHDSRQRASSAGPFTSKYMTERLEEQVKAKGIKIFDRSQAIALLTDGGERVIGLLSLNLNNPAEPDKRFKIFNCQNVIFATGGPAGIYGKSVYPPGQTGSIGLAFEAGARGKNLTESQYGITSSKYRWNLSGTYQQVLPRYLSTDKSGNGEREFLTEYFSDPGAMLDAIFLKGYQWPFDPRKIASSGSALLDILVYNETVLKGRRVFLDYTKNPLAEDFDFNLLGAEAYRYLENSRALFGTPLERLKHMNQQAYNLYKEQGIDLGDEKLEIAVSAQHNNGGLAGNIWWESNLKHLFPVGEVNGSHGIYRPGGSALNSGQVGSTRAAQYIANHYQEPPLPLEQFLNLAGEQIEEKLALGRTFSSRIGGESNLKEIRGEIGQRMDQRGAFIRSLQTATSGAEEALEQLKTLPDRINLSSSNELGIAFKVYDFLLTQFIYLSAIKDYIEAGGKSRGSYLVYDEEGDLPLETLPENFRFRLADGQLEDKIQRVSYRDGQCSFSWEPVTPIPDDDSWFENVWNSYQENKNIY